MGYARQQHERTKRDKADEILSSLPLDKLHSLSRMGLARRDRNGEWRMTSKGASMLPSELRT